MSRLFMRVKIAVDSMEEFGVVNVDHIVGLSTMKGQAETLILIDGNREIKVKDSIDDIMNAIKAISVDQPNKVVPIKGKKK